MKVISIEEGQSIYDIAMQYYGNVAGVEFIMIDNPSIGWTDKLDSSQQIVIRNGDDFPPNMNRDVGNQFMSKRIVVNGGDIKPPNYFWETPTEPWNTPIGDTWDL